LLLKTGDRRGGGGAATSTAQLLQRRAALLQAWEARDVRFTHRRAFQRRLQALAAGGGTEQLLQEIEAEMQHVLQTSLDG